jgi:hypothetical protein
MSDQTNLLALRAELKHKLADGTYDPLAERLVKRVRRFFPSSLQGDVAPFLFLVFVNTSISYLLNLSDSVANFREWLFPAFSAFVLFWFAIFTCLRFQRHLYRVLSGYVIDAMTQPKDIKNLGGWIKRFNNGAITLSFTLIFLAAIMPYQYPLQVAAHGAMGVTTIISLCSGYFLLCLMEYQLVTIMALIVLLSRYYMDLYEVDPNMSPAILNLSRVIRDYVYLLSACTTIGMFYLAYMKVPVFPTALLYIVPTLCIFIFRQITLTRIVTRARDVVLERLRNEIEALDIEHQFDNPALCSQFKAMADYYDSVKNANTGVFDMRVFFLIINSLLLPFTAFLISHFDQFKAFLGW